MELNKANEFSIGSILRVGGLAKYSYTDIDELIERHVKQLARKVEQMLAHEKYRGTQDQLSTSFSRRGVSSCRRRHRPSDFLSSFLHADLYLQNFTMANPGQSAYGFGLDRDTKNNAGQFVVSFRTHQSAEIQSWVSYLIFRAVISQVLSHRTFDQPVKIVPDAFSLLGEEHGDVLALVRYIVPSTTSCVSQPDLLSSFVVQRFQDGLHQSRRQLCAHLRPHSAPPRCRPNTKSLRSHSQPVRYSSCSRGLRRDTTRSTRDAEPLPVRSLSSAPPVVLSPNLADISFPVLWRAHITLLALLLRPATVPARRLNTLRKPVSTRLPKQGSTCHPSVNTLLRRDRSTPSREALILRRAIRDSSSGRGSNRHRPGRAVGIDDPLEVAA